MEISTWELLAAKYADESFENSKKRKGGRWNPYVHKVLRGAMREYVINSIKKPLIKAIITLASRYPCPTRENCLHPNSHRLLDIKDEFFKHEENPDRIALFEALFKMLIAEYEHDGYYRFRFNWFIKELNRRNWGNDPATTFYWRE